MRIVRQFFVYSAFVCAALFLCVLSSCNDVFYQNSDDDSSCYVRFSIADDARTVKPQKLDLETLSYSLVATNGSTVRSASWKNYEDLRNASFQMDVGVWTFTLEAYLDGRKVLSGSKKDIKISVGANKLSFTLSEPATGTGSFSMEIKIGTAPSADVITATLCDMTGKALTEADMGEGYNPETDGALTQSWTTEDFTRDDFDGTVTFAITDHVPKGAYMLTFAMTKGSGDSAVTSTFRTIAAIAAGNESADSYDMSEGTKENPNPNVVAYYSVIYEDGVPDEDIAVPVDTAVYNPNKEDENVVIVNFKDVGERTGYTFSGWRISPTNVIECPKKTEEIVIFKITEPGNVTFTAIWTPNGSTSYKVRHWQQKLNAERTAAAASGSGGTTDKTITEGKTAGAAATCTDYDLFYSEPLSGVTGGSTAAVGKTGSGYAGFAVVLPEGADDVEQKTIAADGSTVVDVFYDRIIYTVYYEDDVEGEEIAVPEPASWCYGAAVSLAFTVDEEPLTRAGYTFTAWSRSSSVRYEPSESAGAAFIMPADDVTLTADWTERDDTAYTVKYWQQSLNEAETAAAGTNTATDYVLFETTVHKGRTNSATNAQAKEYAGFTIVLPEGAEYVPQKSIAADGSTVIDIYYNRITYSVSYNDGVEGEDIAVPEPASWCFGTKVTVAFTVGERTGWTFNGWKKTQNSQSTVLNLPENSDETVIFEMPAGNVTLSAIWTPNGSTLYLVHHWQQNLNEEKTESIEDYDIFETEPCYGFTAAQTEATAKTASTDAKYAGFEAQTVSQKPIAADGSTVIDIYYNRITYRVSYNDGVEGETIGVPDAIQRCFGAKVDVGFGVGDRPGYSFTCWNSSTGDTFTQPESDGNPVTFTMPANAVTLTAAWTERDDTAYMVRHWQQKLNTSGTAVSGTNKTIIKREQDPADAATCADYTLVAHPNLTGTTNGMTAAEANVYDGFTAQNFEQKTIAANGTTVIDIFYDRISYTVSYGDGAGEGLTVPDSTTWCYGATVPVEFAVNGVSVSRIGYTFDCWRRSDTITYRSGTGKSVSFEMPAGDVTLTAQWTPNTTTAYTVKHWQQNVDANDYKLFEITSGTGTTTGPTSASAKVYTGFAAQTFAQDTIAADGSTIINIYYNRNTYTVTYQNGLANNETDATITLPIDSTRYRYGATVTVQFGAMREGYTFLGWSQNDSAIEATYTATGTNTFTMGAGDITLYAVWQANTAGITVNWVNQTADMPLFTYEIGGEGNTTITFTAPAGYSSCTWYLSSQTSVATGNAYAWNTATIASGTYYVTLVATDSAGKKCSSTMKVEVNK